MNYVHPGRERQYWSPTEILPRLTSSMVLEAIRTVDRNITARLVKPGSSMDEAIDALSLTEENVMDALEVAFLTDLNLTLLDESISL